MKWVLIDKLGNIYGQKTEFEWETYECLQVQCNRCLNVYSVQLPPCYCEQPQEVIINLKGEPDEH